MLGKGNSQKQLSEMISYYMSAWWLWGAEVKGRTRTLTFPEDQFEILWWTIIRSLRLSRAEDAIHIDGENWLKNSIAWRTLELGGVHLSKQIFWLILERYLRAVWDTSLGIQHAAIFGRDPKVFHNMEFIAILKFCVIRILDYLALTQVLLGCQ